VGAVSTYTFTDVTSGHTIAASFVATAALNATITGPPAGAIYATGTNVTFTGSFSDSPGRTHTAQWKFDNTTVAGTVNELGGTVSKTYSFPTPGVYIVTLTVTNDLGATATATEVSGNTAMVVIYDPNSGFVTGGGWLDSPAGAYVLGPSLGGRVQYGFVSKYQRNATLPTGETDFKLRFTTFEFTSTSYDWLVVTSPKAQFRGSGKVNGAGSYGFTMTILDGDQLPNHPPDCIRMKIWNKADGQVVYDNQFGAPDSTTPNTPIGGGSIVIHVSGGNGQASMSQLPPSDFETGGMPTAYALGQNYPNPCRDGTRIAFALPEISDARLTVFDLQGRVVVDLIDDLLPPGRYVASWDGRDRMGRPIEAGVYFYRLAARSSASDKRATMVRRFILVR
jgi:PKD repeat protein